MVLIVAVSKSNRNMQTCKLRPQFKTKLLYNIILYTIVDLNSLLIVLIAIECLIFFLLFIIITAFIFLCL